MLPSVTQQTSTDPLTLNRLHIGWSQLKGRQMNEEQPSYKVTDRRLFNPDGSPREVPPEEQPEPKSQPTLESTAATAEAPAVNRTDPVDVSSQTEATAATTSVNPVAASGSEPPPSSPAQQDEEAELDNAEAELPGADDPASFASFMMSIASNAAASLGMMEHPVTHKREVDLELGKHWIDVLGMLQQKTLGNLLPQEKQILEGLLADLRMQYVSLTHAAPQKARTYSSRDIVGG
jgi:hypothetical protein